MKDNTYWFYHDYEPTSDPKIQALIGEYGGAGYGIFWRIIEMLHSDTLHKLPLKNFIFIAIAKQMTANAKQSRSKIQQIEILPDDIKILVEDCIHLFELFATDGEWFWSDRANRNIEKRAKISLSRAESGRKGGNSKANANQLLSKKKQTLARRGEEIRGEIENNKDFKLKTDANENFELSGNFKAQGEELLRSRFGRHSAELDGSGAENSLG